MDVATALEILDTSVDVAILDWMLIGGTCEPILAQIHRDVLPCGVILFSALATTQPAMAVARYREVAFVSKPCAAAELLPYIRVASALADARRGTFTPEILADVPSSPADVDSAELLFKVIEGALQRAGDLSPRVLQVLSCYLRGAELKAISRILGISDSTVRTSIQTARDRCGAESNAEFLRVAAVQLARELRWKKSWPVPGEDA
jgi:DNA-binding NarL/FixJ family response regulator